MTSKQQKTQSEMNEQFNTLTKTIALLTDADLETVLAALDDAKADAPAIFKEVRG